MHAELIVPFFSTRRLIRKTASSTIAMTAGLNPKKTAWINGVCWNRA